MFFFIVFYFLIFGGKNTKQKINSKFKNQKNFLLHLSFTSDIQTIHKQ
ncbi:hypothetical protein HMPREF9074_07644 [Capnocytophaga sp. oral taxon 329 str. F0087]|nr:hypothetical protein HMPREF9074_07644 [Capnocytophaga sp. oral taxon 329 str. F0087]